VNDLKPTHELLQFFEHEHLPPHLAKVSKPFCELAHELVNMLPGAFETDAPLLIRERLWEWEREPVCNVEATWASTKLSEALDDARTARPSFPHAVYPLGSVLRKLLEAKDCAVRSVLYKPVQP
jgi:hypothetical protein